MAGHVPWGEAFLAMLAMMIVLIFVLIYYCVMPVLTAMKRRKQQEEEAWERDPRWNGDKFRYMPKLPENFSTDKKYSRLAACSRSSSSQEKGADSEKISEKKQSMRSENAPKPPNYSDLFDGTQMVNIPSSSPPSYTSKTPSVELSSSNETVNKVKEVREKVKFVKPKKNKKATDEAKQEIIANEEVKVDTNDDKKPEA